MLTYTQTIDYLYNHLPVFHRVGAKAYKADLSNTLALCQHLHNPQHSFKSIHVAGTNGKGSTSHFLAAILQAAGYNVGLYTSPHLKDYTERFRFNGKPIAKSKVVDFVAKNREFLEKLQPSFFEMSVALAFDYFKYLRQKKSLDIAVIEVGLGGRLDSTNVIQPILIHITNIGLDHTDILGDTLVKIAYEKSGIIKNNIPVVVSEYLADTEKVFIEKSQEKQAPLYLVEDTYRTEFIANDGNYMLCNIINVKTNAIVLKNIKSGLCGLYQLKNIAGVYQSIQLLIQAGYAISEENIRQGFEKIISITGLKGRWQILYNEPLTICDTGHNFHGLQKVISQIESLDVNNMHFILGFVKDKDLDAILTLFPRDAKYYFCEANTPRAMSADILLNKAKSLGFEAEIILNVNNAIAHVSKLANKKDLIFIGGSTFVVAEIKNL